ncbi:protein-disulfide reductase DsbD [Neisseriaceae bacterium PsAf]|nr:protein-disulfide reductase DsbD [Neisseriaceae bacterium PsAf]MCV2502979.1 protein-disulfide reductase DsbD [Neisseriaceae bacterium]
MHSRIIRFITFFILVFSFSSFAYTNINSRNILPPEKAFKVIINVDEQNQQNLTIDIAIEPGYYLYQSKFLFNTQPSHILGKATYSDSISHSDEFFGKQQIFRDFVNISIPIENKQGRLFQLDISLQGCADVGICYPPLEKHYKIDNGLVIPLNEEKTSKTRDNQSLVQKLTQQTIIENTSINSNNPNEKFILVPAKESLSTENTNISWTNILQTLLLFFLAGIAMSLTACMYPLIPIVSSIIVNQQQDHGKSFFPTFIYTQGIAFTYTLLGIIAGLSGVLLNAYMQQAIFIIPASLLIILLGLSMLEVFQLQLPSKWQNMLNNAQINTKNRYLALFLMGCVSALIIGPCIAPPLAFALGYIGSTHDVILGGLALYMMGLGMGLPLLIFSLLGDKFLPKTGNWMNVVKYLLGVLLLFIGIYLMAPFLPNWLSILFYSIVFLLPIIIFYKNPAKSFLGKIFYIITSLLGVFLTAYLISSSYLGKSNAFNIFLSAAPSHTTLEMPTNKKYTNVEELMNDIQIALQNNPEEPIYLDFYADWCATCKEMKKYTFSDARVKNILNQNNFFQIDITNNTKEHRELMEMFNLYAPPGFFIIKSPNVYSKPLLGFEKPEAFIKWIEKTKQEF